MSISASDSVTAITGVGTATKRRVGDTVEDFVFGSKTVHAFSGHKEEAAHEIEQADFSNTGHNTDEIVLNKLHTATKGALYTDDGELKQRGHFHGYRKDEKESRPMDFIWTRHALYGDWSVDLPRTTADFQTEATTLIPAHYAERGYDECVYVVTTGETSMAPNERVVHPHHSETETIIPARPLRRFAAVLNTSPSGLVDYMYFDQDSPVFINPPNTSVQALFAASRVERREQQAVQWSQTTPPSNGFSPRYILPIDT